MRKSVVFVIAVLALFSSTRAGGGGDDPDVDETDVHVLTDKNFDDFVNNADLVLVEFYAPWCGHCKHLKPEYARAATQLKDKGVLLAKVDATVETGLASRFGIQGYPTLKIFRRGNVAEYNGPRETNGIVKYMAAQVGPSAKPIKSAEELSAFLAQKDVKVVGYVSDEKSAIGKAFLAAADSLREHFKLAIVTDASLAGEHKNSIVLHKDFDELENVFSGSANKDAISDFIWANSVPSAGVYNSDTKPRYDKKNLPILKFFVDVNFESNAKRTNYYLNRLKKLAENEAAKGKLLFALADRKTYNKDIEKLGLSGSSGEVVVGIEDAANSQKYKFTEEFSVPNLQKFVSDFLGGKLKNFIKSEAVPDNTNNDVTVVVGETFNDIVMDPTKDILFEMYAPWCGHCKKLAPVFDELGKTVKDSGVSNLVIAKMDATANDSPHPKYQAKGYPTLFFAKAGDKENPVPYKGDRDLQSFVNFLKKESTSFRGAKTEL